MSWLSNQLQRLGIERRKLYAATFAVGFTIVVFADSNYFEHFVLKGIWLAIFTALFFIFLVAFLLAGSIIFRALAVVSVTFGILFFLSKEYCAISTTSIGIDAIRLLWLAGGAFMLYEFLERVRKIATDYCKKYKVKRQLSREEALILICICIGTALLLGSLYVALRPIVLSLCIFSGLSL